MANKIKKIITNFIITIISGNIAGKNVLHVVVK